MGSSSSSTLAADTTRVASASRVFSPPDSTAAGLCASSPENRNEPSTLRAWVSVRSGAGGVHVLQHGAVEVEGLVLLGVVAELEAVPGHAPRRCRARRCPPRIRSSVVLPAPLRPRTTTREPAVDRQVDVGEDLQRAVRLRQLLGHQRRLAARRRLGEARSCATLSLRRSPSSPASSRSARLAMFCAATALVALARILSACAHQRGRPSSRRWPARACGGARRSRAAAGTPSSRRCRRRARPGWRRGGTPW